LDIADDEDVTPQQIYEVQELVTRRSAAQANQRTVMP
jgi:hypothetical protein